MLLTVTVLSGCGTTRIVTVKPECGPAVRPVLMRVEPGELSQVSDDTYRKLQVNERRLQNWGIANEKIILKVCKSTLQN